MVNCTINYAAHSALCVPWNQYSLQWVCTAFGAPDWMVHPKCVPSLPWYTGYIFAVHKHFHTCKALTLTDWRALRYVQWSSLARFVYPDFRGKQKFHTCAAMTFTNGYSNWRVLRFLHYSSCHRIEWCTQNLYSVYHARRGIFSRQHKFHTCKRITYSNWRVVRSLQYSWCTRLNGVPKICNPFTMVDGVYFPGKQRVPHLQSYHI